MTDWISVEDRLPEPGRRVLCYRGRRHSETPYIFVGSNDREGGEWWVLPETGYTTRRVTYWAELEPPEEEK